MFLFIGAAHRLWRTLHLSLKRTKIQKVEHKIK